MAMSFTLHHLRRKIGQIANGKEKMIENCKFFVVVCVNRVKLQYETIYHTHHTYLKSL